MKARLVAALLCAHDILVHAFPMPGVCLRYSVRSAASSKVIPFFALFYENESMRPLCSQLINFKKTVFFLGNKIS